MNNTDPLSITLPVVPVIPPTVVSGQIIAAAHENQVVQALNDLWTDVQALGVGVVPSTRKVIAGTGLSGGGDLTADRTFTVNSAAIAAGIQTPWLQNIDGNFKSLSNVAGLQMGGPFSCAGTASIVGPLTLNATLFATSSNNKIAVTCDTIQTTGNVGISGAPYYTRLGITCGTSPSLSYTSADALAILSPGGAAMILGLDSAAPYDGWIQMRHSNANGASYPLSLQPVAGLVGIGITTPTRPLHVANVPGGQGIAITGVGPCLQLSNAATEPNNNTMTATFALATAATHYGLNAGDIGIFNMGTARGNIVISSNYSGGGANRALLLQPAGGYVGINVQVNLAPVAQLEVVQIQGVSGIKNGGLEFQSHVVNNSYWNENCYFNGTTYVYRISGYANMVRILNGQWDFYPAPSGTAGAQMVTNTALCIANNGYVGVNVQPITTFHTYGGMLSQQIGGGGPWYTAVGYNPTAIPSGTAGGMWLDSVTNSLRIEAITPGVVWRNIAFCGSGSSAGGTGRVSIGWPVPYNPLGILDVNFAPAIPCIKAGSLELISTQPGIAGIGENITFNGTAWVYRVAGTGSLIQWYAAGLTILMAPSGAAGAAAPLLNVVQITNAGYVGIGASNPQAKLDVAGNVNVSAILSIGYGTAQTGQQLQFLDQAGSGHPFVLFNYSDVFYLRNWAAAPLLTVVGTSGLATFFGQLCVNALIQNPGMATANPGAGSKCLWADPADGYRVKFAV